MGQVPDSTRAARAAALQTSSAPAPGTALPGVPATLAAAAKKSAGLLLMRVALMLRRGRMRTPERGVMERGVMSAAGRGGPPDRRPAGRCVRPTLYSGAGDTCRCRAGWRG